MEVRIQHPDWFASRMVGIGESINLFGLLCGTDNLLSVMNASALIILAITVTALTSPQNENYHRSVLLGWMFIFAAPALASIIPTQKPQFFPTACACAALVLVLQAKDQVNHRAGLVFPALTFALGCRTSFLLSAAIAAAIALYFAYRNRQFLPTFAWAVGCTIVFTLPFFARNIVFYGDPLSPFLERLKAQPDPVLVSYATYLRNYEGEHSLVRILRLPYDMTIPWPVTTRIAVVLGLGFWSFLLVIFQGSNPTQRTAVRTLILAAGVSTVVTAVLGQLGTRFFLEAYFWAATAAVTTQWRVGSTWFLRGLALQSLATVLVVWSGTVALFPGALTRAGREHTLTKLASGYALCQWLNGILPANAVVILDARSRAFFNRTMMHADLGGVFQSETEQMQRMLPALRAQGVTHTVVPIITEAIPGRYPWVIRCYGTKVAGPANIPQAVRNPFVRGALSLWVVYALDFSQNRCMTARLSSEGQLP